MIYSMEELHPTSVETSAEDRIQSLKGQFEATRCELDEQRLAIQIAETKCVHLVNRLRKLKREIRELKERR